MSQPATLQTGTRSTFARTGPIPKPVVKNCELCGTQFSFKSSGEANNRKRRFCTTGCAAKWRMTQESIKSQIIPGLLLGQKKAAERRKGSSNPRAAERMRKNNPMSNPTYRERARQKLIGRTFLSRGGNGKLTPQQIAIHDATGYPTEFAIATAPVKEMFQSLPPVYKVDLAVPESKLAIEVDGKTHRLKKWKFLDARKTAVLNALGWRVLRFWNEEVTDNLPKVLETISASIASK